MARKKQTLIRLALLATLVATGLLIGGYYLSWSKPEAAVEPPPATPEIAQEPVSAPTPIDPQEQREVAEKLIRNNRYKRAIPHLLNVAAERIEDSDDELLFRIALCFEASGDFDRADDYYTVIADRTNHPQLASGCRNGKARCRLQLGNMTSGRRLVWRNFMLADQQGPLNRFNEESLQILGLSFANQTDRWAMPLLDDRSLIQGFQPALSVARQISLLKESETASETASKTASETANATDSPNGNLAMPGSQTNRVNIDHIMKAGEQPDDIFASYVGDRVPLEMLMQWTMTKLGVEIAITEEARKIAETQTISIDLKHISLPTILDVQTLPFGLGWRQKDGVTTIFSLAEVSPEIGELLRQNAAVRIINRVVLLAPSHIHVAYLRFQLAGLYFQLGAIRQSLALHQDLLSGKPIDSRLRRAVHFNLGQLQALYGDPQQAIESFENVVDSNEQGEIKTVAWLRIGQTHVQLGNHNEAITSFLRASRSTNQPFFQELSTLGIASTYVLSGRPRLAVATLGNSKQFLRGSELNMSANFLRAFCDYESSGQTLDSSRRLLTSLASLNWPTALQNSGDLLKAKAWKRLGFADEAIRALHRVVKKSESEWLLQNSVEQLSELLIKEQRLGDAQRVLQEALDTPQARNSPVLSARLANVEYQLGDYKECMRLCGTVLANPKANSVYGEVLKTMGKIYQERGDHYTAALCFSGLAPMSAELLTAEAPR